MAIHMRKVLGGAQPPRALAPARAQAACQGADRYLSKPPTSPHDGEGLQIGW
jgi:hypothetical protein